MDKLIAQLKEYLAIDKLALDDEVVKQPALFFQVAEAVAEAVAERDGSKEELATTDAELDAKFRHQLEVADERVTDKKVEKLVQSDARHGEAFDTYLLAKSRADKLIGLKEAYQQRGYMLRDLVSLHETSYYDRGSIKGSQNMQEVRHDRARAKLLELRRTRKDR